MSPRPTSRFRIGSLMPFIALAIAVGSISVAVLTSYGWMPFSRLMRAEPTTQELDASLRRVGINAETLCAAGCSSADAAEVASDASTHLDSTAWAALQTADANVTSARQDTERLGRIVRSGQATGEQVSEYATAQTDLADDTSARDALLSDLFDAAVDSLEAGEVTFLNAMHAASGKHGPLAYRVASRTDAEWVSIRDSLGNLKTAPICNEETLQDCEDMIAAVDAELDVAAAQSRLDSSLGQIAAAFNDALGYE